MSDRIEIKFESKDLSPEKFIRGIEDFFIIVKGVAKNTSSRPIDWAVEVERGSSIVRMLVKNPSPESAQSLDFVSQGIRAMRNRITSVPGFKRDEIYAARRLAQLTDGEEAQSVSIQNGGEPEGITPTIIDTANAILEGASEDAFGSIEGHIVSLSARQRLECTIDDPILRREIPCYLQTAEAQQDAWTGFNKRVVATGLIHYSKEGYAVSVTVNRLRIFPPESELPALEEIQAIYKEL